jgi:fatty acid desaturase
MGLELADAPSRSSEEAYKALRREVIAAGLLKRDYRYYLWRAPLSFTFFIAAALMVFTIARTPLGWITATLALGFATVQVALIGHDAGHLAVFRATPRNWALGQLCWTLVVGVSFWYWNDRHNKHHGHTNDLDEDPDMQGRGVLAVAFTEEEAASRTGWRRAITRFQLPLIFIGLFLFYPAFRVEGWVYALRRSRGWRRVVEVALLFINAAMWATPIWLLGWSGLGLVFGAHLAASLYLGGIIAPNHKGMPTWARGARLSFLERQTLSSRNVNGRPLWDFLFGGLNYQIEHHLFPTMPRSNLNKLQRIVKPFCAAHGLPYEEMSPTASYRIVYHELRRAARAAV